jgi:hypothetical protein
MAMFSFAAVATDDADENQFVSANWVMQTAPMRFR